MVMTNIVLQIASKSGESESCNIDFDQGSPIEIRVLTQHFGAMTLTDNDLFSALVKLRLRLEQGGYFLLCNAARKNAYPSRMTREMGGGRKLYLLTHGMQARREDLVDIFCATSLDQVSTVTEQYAYYEDWIRSLK